MLYKPISQEWSMGSLSDWQAWKLYVTIAISVEVPHFQQSHLDILSFLCLYLLCHLPCSSNNAVSPPVDGVWFPHLCSAMAVNLSLPSHRFMFLLFHLESLFGLLTVHLATTSYNCNGLMSARKIYELPHLMELMYSYTEWRTILQLRWRTWPSCWTRRRGSMKWIFSSAWLW